MRPWNITWTDPCNLCRNNHIPRETTKGISISLYIVKQFYLEQIIMLYIYIIVISFFLAFEKSAVKCFVKTNLFQNCWT